MSNITCLMHKIRTILVPCSVFVALSDSSCRASFNPKPGLVVSLAFANSRASLSSQL